VGVATPGGAPFSLTMFLHEDNLSSKAPTFRNKSPTMFKADSLAEGVSVLLCRGEVFEEDGGVSSRMGVEGDPEMPPFSPFPVTSAACLLESGLDFPLFRLLFLSAFIFICKSRDLSLSGGLEPFTVEPFTGRVSPEGPFIYYVGTFFLSTATFSQIFLNVFLLLYVLNISNYSMKISSKCNMY
jgi:hypothetical protein